MSTPNDSNTDNKAMPLPDTSGKLDNSITLEETLPLSPTLPDQNYAPPWLPDSGNAKPPEEINILLLGESGVGKSTFINSFANYMKHKTFEAVQKNDLTVLIPSRFNIFDQNLQKHVIEVGANDNNEHMEDGASATQNVRAYVFYVKMGGKSYQIRLIDTPGMGDPRGIERDNKNCDYILKYLGRLDQLHAICMLLKPNNTRFDVFLNYCMTQLFSRLDKSAVDNVAFLFTNTRGQNYSPGDTYISLEMIVKKIKDNNNVVVPLNINNVFCVDNEAFRFLAAVKQGVIFRKGVLESNIESWKFSYQEIYRLLSYVAGMKPHDTRKTITINNARRMALQLIQSLPAVVELIGDNIYELDQRKRDLSRQNQSVEELKQKLHMPVIDIRVKKLDCPATVCTSPKCSTIYKVAGRNKFHYKQQCHSPCFLNATPAEVVGDPRLLDCICFNNKYTEICKKCQCHLSTHMHVYYETEVFQNKIVDENVLSNINNKEDAAKAKQQIIDKISNQKEELEKELTCVISYCAALTYFLQQNAVTPVNDYLEDNIKYLITRERNLGQNANSATLIYLRTILGKYKKEKEELAKSGSSGSAPDEIEKKIRELFNLRSFGSRIKQLYDLHQTGGKTEQAQSEIIVNELYQLSEANR